MTHISFVPELNGSGRREEAQRAVAGVPILVVEDNESIRGLIQVVLKSAGYEVHTVSDAERAFEAALSIRPRMILTDIQLPGMNGLELTRRLRADAATADIIILAVTAYAMEGDDRKAREAGCDGYISKPLDVKALPDTVSEYLGRSFTRSDGTEDFGSPASS
jgi:CheY-like chemotaxis protein